MHRQRFFHIIAVLVSFSVLLMSCKEAEYQYSHGNIFGKISDATTGEFIENCNISVSNPAGEIMDRQRTDKTGAFKTKDLEDGEYVVAVEKEDYYTGASKRVKVISGETTQCDIALGRIPAKITADTEEVDFGANASLTTLSFKIVNRYLDDLDWIIEYECDWIVSITPTNDNLAHGKTATIVVKIDRSKLSGGENKTNIVVKSLNGQGGVNVTIKATGQEKEAPVLNVTGVSGIDMTAATLAGEIVSPGTPPYTRRGFTVSLNSKDESAVEMVAKTDANASFTYTVTGLTAGKRYYVRAFAENESAGKVWSVNEMSFTTIGSYPSIRTDGVTELNLAEGSCLLNGFVEQVGEPSYSEKGFCVSDSGEPTVSDNKYAVAGSGAGAFSSALSGIVTEKTYRVRTYIVQNDRVFYGSTVAFSTATTSTSVATTGASSVTHNSATLNGSILNEGNPRYTERGFCFSTTNSMPTITDSKVSVPISASADFSYKMTSLEHNRTFRFRAYAIQNGKPTYGEVASFVTTWVETTVFTQAASDVKYREMTLNGRINAAGIPEYTQKGFCYSYLHEEPTLQNATKVTVSGNGDGPFAFHLTGLYVHTVYYYRAYAIQDGKTLYGAVMSSSTYSPPQVITSDSYARADDGMMNISWTVTLSGVYGFKGNPECSDWGFVYGPGESPSAENTYGYTVVKATSIDPFPNGEGGGFSVELKEIPGYSRYYYRAYARTAFGYTYGDVMSFSTQP